MIYPVLLYGNPILRERAKEVPFATNITQLVKDMFETMHNAKGCGLAAPQIGKSIQMFVLELALEEGAEPVRHVIINPIIEVNEKAKASVYEEGCLSIPGVLVPVSRIENIKIKFFDQNWKKREEKIDGFLARVMLHEYDHLMGRLHVDYAISEYKESIKEELEKISKGEVKTEYEVIK